MNLSAWVLSIVGIVVLTLMVDIIIPEGKTGKYIKGVFAMLTVFVIAMPLPKIFNNYVRRKRGNKKYGGENKRAE